MSGKSMITTINIRPAKKNDSADICRLINRIQRDEFGILITIDDQPDLADIDQFYRMGAGDFWVAETLGRIVGTIALIDIGQRGGALRKMFVHKEFRGVETGVARKLLDALLVHARESGLTKIFLGTAAKFLAAHRFYEKNGFTPIDVKKLPEGFPRMTVDTLFYQADLRSFTI